jgi:small subunit ribosomal protein S17
MSKTRTILVDRRRKHPKYGKYINLSTKYHAHDEKDISKEGDEVLIQECRPISKTKSWKILEVLDGKKTVKNKTKNTVKKEIKAEEEKE